MTPGELLRTIGKKPLAPAYLFLGPDHYSRRFAREALIEAALAGEDPDSGVTRLDLDESPLVAVLDDAGALSLFAQRRVLLVSNAEAALPRRLSSKEDDDSGPRTLLAQYLKNPTPDTVIVFDCARYGFDGDDKQKLERVRKFYSAIPAVVEFAPFAPADAAKLARELASRHKLPLTEPQVEMLVEALGADASRIAVEVEKLALFAGGRAVTDSEIASLIPNARASNIFALVNAVARGNRGAALEALDTLVKEGEYLPLVLTFLGTQFRLAMAAADAGVRDTGAVQAYFSKTGVPMWRARAEQLSETLRVFPAAKLRRAIPLVFEADRALRDTRPDDRTVVEAFVWKLTS